MSLLCNRILLCFDSLGLFFPSLILSFYAVDNENHPIMIGTSAYSVSTFFRVDFVKLGVWRVSKKSGRSQVSVMLSVALSLLECFTPHACLNRSYFKPSCLNCYINLLRDCFSIYLILSANLSQNPLFKPVPQKNTFAAFVWYQLVNEHLHGNVVST